MGKIDTALKLKCPRCDKGSLYEHNSLLPFSKKTFEMKKNCPNCGLKYEREVGFFYGAMFVSYALNVAAFTVCILTYLLFFQEKYSWYYFGAAYLLVTFLLVGVFFRLSRSLWLALMIKREPNRAS